MFQLSDDDKWTIQRIATLAVNCGGFYVQKARDQEVKDIISCPPNIGAARNDYATTSENSNMGSNEFRHASHEQMRTLLKTLESDLVNIGQGFMTVNVPKQASTLFKILEYRGNMLQSIWRDILLAAKADGSSPLPADLLKACIQGIADVVSKLKLQIPRTGYVRVESASDLINHLIGLPAYRKFAGWMALQDFEQNYRSLDSRSMHCLFCFSVFPAGFVVEKRSMTYWWVGEGLIGDAELDGHKVAEEVANEILKKFLEFGFVEPMIKKGKFFGLRMNPVIGYAVAYFAERAGFCDFDFQWNPTADFQLCGNAFLVKNGEQYSRQMLREDKHLNPEKLRTLLNVNDPHPNFETKWFSRARNVNVLCLGTFAVDGFRCKYVGSRDVKFLTGLKYMKHLKLFSLGGYSGSFRPPIGKLKNLRILNLNDCVTLRLPSNIGSLKRLTHLNCSERYLLDGLPKGIKQLRELQVLKGFVISDAEDTRFATLDDLAGLKKLRKLSICSHTEAFPAAHELNALWHMRSLRKPHVWWRWRVPLSLERNPSIPRIMARSNSSRLQESGVMIPELPRDLEKLELRDFPETKAPCWLDASKLKCLKKLYINGGNLHDLHQAQGPNDMWKVKIIGLGQLPEFHMDWTRVQYEFPDLIYVEKDGCPKLTSFPCDDSGVWLNNKTSSEDLLKEVGFSWSFLATGTC